MDRSVLEGLLEGDEWPLAFLLSDKFLSFLDLIPEAVVISQPDGAIIQVNDQAARAFGYSRNEFLALKIEDLVPKRFRGHHVEKRDFYYAHPKPRFLDNRKYDLYALAKGDREFAMEAALFAFKTDQGKVAVNLIRDVTHAKSRQEKMEQENESLSEIAGIDQLTQIANRREFDKVFSRQLAKARRHEQKLALLFIDLDHFKPINDQYGHQAGDRLLQEVSLRIKDTLREEDFIARIGGDEFTVLIYPVEQMKDVERAAQRIIERCKKKIAVDGNEFVIGVSIGIASYPQCEGETKALLSLADQRMYEAKQQGGNKYCGLKPK